MSNPEGSRRDLWFAAAAGAALVALIGFSASLVAPGMATAHDWIKERRGDRHWGADGHRQDRHVERAVSWFADFVEADDAQEARIRDVVTRALTGLSETRVDHEALRDELIAELRKPEIDRQALERVRRAQLERVESVSRELVDALAEIGEVLTPEQREELAELAEDFGERHGHGRRWRRWRH